MKNERTTLFLISNLGVEMQRLFSYSSEEKDKMTASAERAKSIIEQIVQKDDVCNGYKEMEKLSDIITDKLHLNILAVTKHQLQAYFHPFIVRNSAIL